MAQHTYEMSPIKKNSDAVETLFNHLSSQDQNTFITDFSELAKDSETKSNILSSILAANNGTFTMLEIAANKGLKNVVSLLLEKGANPNETYRKNTKRPIALACHNGFSEILKMFMDNDKTSYETNNSESLIQITVKGMRSYAVHPESNFNECLNLLLSNTKVKLNVNYTDIKGNTALHYAARNGDSTTVLKLLRHGACVSLRNIFNEPALADIDAKTLKTYLDDCLDSNKKANDDNFEIYIKYNFLVYPKSLENQISESVPIAKANNNSSKYVTFSPETDALLFMSRLKELRPLIRHPVLASFSYLKWQRISCYFYVNFAFYFLFWLTLILYILLDYEVVTHVCIIIGLILLIIRELFQLLISRFRYFKLENCLEIAVIVLTISLICINSTENSIKLQISAIVILLSSAEFILLIGEFPALSPFNAMFKRVSKNFLKFLPCYSILIIAFALSFYTLFTTSNSKDADPKNCTEDKDENFFVNPGMSLLKTIVMLTGEFDASSIKFNTVPITSHIIFIVFVFMIPIVLLNLLMGLAVSDTQKIRDEAELYSYISRINLICYFESVLYGNTGAYAKPSNNATWLPTWLQNLSITKQSKIRITPLAKRISLFPHILPKHMIIVKPNQGNKIEIPRLEPSGNFEDKNDIESNSVEPFRNYILDDKIVKKAKTIINIKCVNVKNKLTQIKLQIEDLQKTIESTENYEK